MKTCPKCGENKLECTVKVYLSVDKGTGEYYFDDGGGPGAEVVNFYCDVCGDLEYEDDALVMEADRAYDFVTKRLAA